MEFLKKIGKPAVLEQLGEESAELTQAALKYARLLRGENPTPKSEMECLDNLTEEIADTLLCIDVLYDLIDKDRLVATIAQKRKRWELRITEAGCKDACEIGGGA